MRSLRLPFPSLAAAALAAGLAACSTPGMAPSDGLAPAPGPDVPAKYSAEEIVGRWGLASYQRDQDRARTETQARSQCRQPYVISKGPTGGVMMHLADQRQQSELRLKGAAGGRTFIGPPDEPAGGALDREILSFDGRVMVTRYVDPDAGNRYGNMVYVRCAPRA